MPCFPRSRWLLGLSATLALGLPAPSASAGQRSGPESPRAARHASSGHHDDHAPAWQRPFGWHRGFGWGWGNGHRSGSWQAWGATWHDQLCELLAEELGERDHWGRGGLLSHFCGCGLPDAGGPPQPASDPVASPPDDALVDETGTAVADLGSVDVDSGAIRVPFASSLADPVVILGPATAHDSEPGVARVLAVDAQGFRARFDEWSYLDGVHGSENVSYLALASGRHTFANGSVWEAGVMDLSDVGAWGGATFSAPFAAPPLLFLTVQTSGDPDPVIVRARDVTSTGFQAALFEEEGADGVHGVERVGYLAVESPQDSGRMNVAAGSLPYLMRSVVADDRRVPVLSSALWLEEEASLDDELVHADETVAFLAIGPKVFAQADSSDDLDPVAVRRAAPEYGPVLEWGTLSDVDDSWHTVPLARSYTDPVVVVGPMSSDNPDPGVLRVRNASADAFELRVQSWSYLGSLHGPERVFYLVTEPGIQTLGGLVVEAGHLQSSMVLADGRDDVAYALPFPDMPGVFASVMTHNGTDPVTVRVADRDANGFSMAMQPEDAATGGHPEETLGWVSIQAGRGVTGDGRVVSVFDAAVDHNPVVVPFGETLSGRFPNLLTQVGSILGLDAVVVRYSALGPDDVTLRIQEEQSEDAETGHRVEDVSVFVGE